MALFVGLKLHCATDRDTRLPGRAQGVKGNGAGSVGVFEFGLRKGTGRCDGRST